MTMTLTREERRTLIEQIRALPAQLEALVSGLNAAQLTTHYLAGEWNVAQNVHHLADSHMNAFIRLKLILTEEHPSLKPYDQDRWAERADAQNPGIETSLTLLKGLHQRWSALFASLADDEWQRNGFHPEHGDITVADILHTYAGHGTAHIDQITRTLQAQ